jgi:hypothetical protein
VTRRISVAPTKVGPLLQKMKSPPEIAGFPGTSNETVEPDPNADRANRHQAGRNVAVAGLASG